ncbi:MAG: DUF2478 domain-containing protein [Pseudomonadota bacterium]
MKKLIAIIYPNEEFPASTFEVLVQECRARGMSLAGVLQFPAFKGGDHRCDVILEDLASGHRTPLFENRGTGARGCRLDYAALAEVVARIEGSLEAGPDLLILNKFGKVECDGGGFRDVIASASNLGIPIVIGVPSRNIDWWRRFSGGLSMEISADEANVWHCLIDQLAHTDPRPTFPVGAR